MSSMSAMSTASTVPTVSAVSDHELRQSACSRASAELERYIRSRSRFVFKRQTSDCFHVRVETSNYKFDHMSVSVPFSANWEITNGVDPVYEIALIRWDKLASVESLGYDGPCRFSTQDGVLNELFRLTDLAKTIDDSSDDESTGYFGYNWD